MKRSFVCCLLVCIFAAASFSTLACDRVRDLIGGGEPPADTPQSAEAVVEEYRQSILEGDYGKLDVEELLDTALSPAYKNRDEVKDALFLRREEALPLLKNRLDLETFKSVTEEKQCRLLMFAQDHFYWEDLSAEIIPILNDNSIPEHVRASAAVTASLYRNDEVVPAVRKLFNTAGCSQARQLTAISLGRLGDTESIESVEKTLLTADSPHEAATLAAVLGSLGSSAGEAEALKLSRHESFDVRIRAAEALLYTGSPEAVDRLTEMRESDPSPAVRSEVNEMIGCAVLTSMEKTEALETLEQLIILNEEYFAQEPEFVKPIPQRWAYVYLAENLGAEGNELLKRLAETPGPLKGPATKALLKADAGVSIIIVDGASVVENENAVIGGYSRGFSYVPAGTPTMNTDDIELGDFFIEPGDIYIEPGDLVIWTGSTFIDPNDCCIFIVPGDTFLEPDDCCIYIEYGDNFTALGEYFLENDPAEKVRAIAPDSIAYLPGRITGNQAGYWAIDGIGFYGKLDRYFQDEWLAVCEASDLFPAPVSIDYPVKSSDGRYSVIWESPAFEIAGEPDGYLLERSNNGGETWTKLYRGPNTEYEEEITVNGYYRYRVRTHWGGIHSIAEGNDYDCRVLLDASAPVEERPEPEAVTVNLNVRSTGAEKVVITSQTGHGGTTDYKLSGMVPGKKVTLEAPEYVGSGESRYRFQSWLGAVESKNRSIVFDLDADQFVVAEYIADPEEVTKPDQPEEVAKPPAKYTLSVSSNVDEPSVNYGVKIFSKTGHGGTTPYTITGIEEGTQVHLEAGDLSDLNGNFIKWSGSISDEKRSINFTMDSDKKLQANYWYDLF